MNPPMVNSNRRILVVDDNHSIHDDFRKILGAPDAADAALDAVEAKLFGKPQSVSFEIDTAAQGEAGLQMVERALAEGRPYAMAFVDFRMPPGWDGVETMRRLWQVCPELQIVICTAFADCPWNEVLEELNPLDRLLILKKPFDSIEVLQLARALTEKWRLRQEAKTQMGTLEQAVQHRTQELEKSQLAAQSMMEDAVHNREKMQHLYEDLKHEVAERKKVEAQFLQVQKMDAIGQLAGGIAHDFNNILGAILGNVELAKMEAPVNPATEDRLDAIRKASQRASDLVRQILTFSRRHEQERRPMRLQTVVCEVLKMLRATLPAMIEFKTSLADTPTVLADPTQIHQVLMNLCTNAAHAMADRPGVLKVELAVMEVDADFAQTHPDLRPGSYVRLMVADNGCGMDRATVERIYEPFFTTKALGEGTGLGLSVVHGIIKTHDGSIAVYSQPGEGTTFHLYFPVFDAEAVEPAAKSEPVPRGQGQHILFVDDEEPLTAVSKNVLQRLGYQVTTKNSGIEALATVRAHPDRFALVVTDLAMPGMSGTDLARKLLDIWPRLPIILTTGYSLTLTPVGVRQMGFRELLLKPNSIRTLGETVHRVLTEANPI